MTWNYRIVAELDPTRSWFYSIRDVYYKGKKAVSWGAEPQAPMGEAGNLVISDLLLMQKAMSQPLLVVIKGKLVEHPRKSPITAKAEDLLAN